MIPSNGLLWTPARYHPFSEAVMDTCMLLSVLMGCHGHQHITTCCHRPSRTRACHHLFWWVVVSLCTLSTENNILFQDEKWRIWHRKIRDFPQEVEVTAISCVIPSGFETAGWLVLAMKEELGGKEERRDCTLLLVIFLLHSRLELRLQWKSDKFLVVAELIILDEIFLSLKKTYYSYFTSQCSLHYIFF